MTASEIRISVVVGAAFALLMLASVLDEYSNKKLSVLFFVLFWAPMLAVHELGHALAAKLLGWRVREIVIGFGRDLWQWQFGETRVKVKLVPIEGYVLPAPVVPSRVRLKSMLVYAAGPGAELLILGVIVLAIGWDTLFSESSATSMIALQSLAVVIVLGAGFNLLPFRSEGAVSDGLGIISSPFMSSESIELRLLTFELREIRRMLEAGEAERAVDSVTAQLRKFPGNFYLQLLLGQAMSVNRQIDAARRLVQEKLDAGDLPDNLRREWLHLQAQIELDADEPSYLILDLALQQALQTTPRAPDLLATKGASLVLRGQSESGGNMLADAWRRNDGSADDAMMLAYLTIAAHRCGDREARNHFEESFHRINRSKALARRVEHSLGRDRG